MLSLRTHPQRFHGPLAAGLIVLFAVFLIWPIVHVVWSGFVRSDGSFTFVYLKLVFTDPTLLRGLLNAALLGIGVTLVTLILSLPLALLNVRYDFPGRALLSGLLLVPLVLPPFVGAMGIKQVLAREGPLTLIVQMIAGWVGVEGSFPAGIDWLASPSLRIVGILIVEALHLYPVMLLNLQAALANIDPAMQQSAANLGAGRWTIFRRITLPLIRPGLFAGATLVLIWAFTEMGTPLMFNLYDVTPVQLFMMLTEVASTSLPFALVVVMLIASTLLYLIGKVLLGRGFDASTTKASVAGSAIRLRGWRGWGATLLFLFVIAMAILPHISVILLSVSKTGAWYRTLLPAEFTATHFGQAMVDDLAFSSINNSLLYASLATLLAVTIGLAAAVIIVRSTLRFRGLIDSLAMLPLAVPGIVLAFGYLAISIKFKRMWGEKTPAFLDVQEFPLVLLVIAYAARRLPYVVRSAVAGLQQTPRDLELAAANLGAGRLRVLFRITMPLILANLVAGGLLAFAFAMLEVSDSLILAQRMKWFPITKAILDISQRLGDGAYIACALGVWAMLLLTFTLLAANSLLGKKMGAIFRI